MISRSRKAKKAQPRSNFLNKAQRKELRKSLIDRYTKDFGLAQPELVRRMVADFFASGRPVNSGSIADLEKQIKRAVIRGKGDQRPQRGAEKRASDLSESQGEGETEEQERVEPMQQFKRAVLDKIEGEKRRKVVEGTLGLDYLDGILEEEMGLMSKNAERTRLKEYMEEQEKAIQHKMKVLGQKMVKQELDLQKREKEAKSEHQRQEDKRYEKAIREKIRAEEEERRREEQRKKEEKKRTRKVQDKIIRERRERLREMEEKEEAENRELVRAIKEDLKCQEEREKQRFKVGLTRS